MKRCPKGVFCIENTTMIFLFLIISMFLLVIYLKFGKNIEMPNINTRLPQIRLPSPFYINSNALSSNSPTNVLMNPHVPPLKNTHYFRSDSGDIRGIPINIKTNSMNVEYSQVGILTRNDEKDTILPLMGRPLQTNRQKWQYYTMSAKHNNVKLPISKAGRNCTGEYGCDELYNGDSVYVEGFNDSFKVIIYENNGPRYIPL